MPLRPPRKCSTDGDGMVIFGVTLVCSLTNRKWSRNGWLEKPTLPVTLTPRALVSTPANSMPCSASYPSTPSSPSRKSKCHQARRYSPSVTSCMPISSCFLISFSISVSSTFFRSAALICPFSRFARASLSGSERRKLPTWSARNGALVLCTFLSLGRRCRALYRVKSRVQSGVTARPLQPGFAHAPMRLRDGLRPTPKGRVSRDEPAADQFPAVVQHHAGEPSGNDIARPCESAGLLHRGDWPESVGGIRHYDLLPRGRGARPSQPHLEEDKGRACL